MVVFRDFPLTFDRQFNCRGTFGLLVEFPVSCSSELLTTLSTGHRNYTSPSVFARARADMILRPWNMSRGELVGGESELLSRINHSCSGENDNVNVYNSVPLRVSDRRGGSLQVILLAGHYQACRIVTSEAKGE